MPSSRSDRRCADLARQRGVHAGHGLIEQQQGGFGHQGAADLEQFLLPAGQLGRALVRHARQVQALGDGVGTRAQLGLAAAGCGGAQQRGQDALTRLVLTVQQQVLQHGQAREAPRYLKAAHQAGGGDAIRPPARDRPAVEADAAGVRRHQAGDAVEQCRLAGTVRPDEAGDTTGLHAQIDAAQGVHAVIAAGQAADFEQGHTMRRRGIAPEEMPANRSVAWIAASCAVPGCGVHGQQLVVALVSSDGGPRWRSNSVPRASSS